MTLDNHIQGDFDPNNPVNQNESNSEFMPLEYYLNEREENGLELLSEIRKEVQLLRELCKQTNNDGNKDFLINRLSKIYQKL